MNQSLPRKRESQVEKKANGKDWTNSVAVSELDSYEAHCEAKWRAREKRVKEALEVESKIGRANKLTYKERKELEQKKQKQEVKQKWNSVDNAITNTTRKWVLFWKVTVELNMVHQICFLVCLALITLKIYHVRCVWCMSCFLWSPGGAQPLSR